MSKITVALMRNLEHQVNQGEISYSRMVEILNETIQPTTPQPSKSASEILKQYELFNYNDGNIDETHVYFENAVTAMMEYASQFQQPQQQKPLVVLPEILQDKYAWSRIVKIVKKVKEELPESSNTVIGIECIREVCREIHNELSASNGVDLKPIIQSLFNVTFMAQKLWDESKPIKDNEFMTVTHPTIIEAQEHLVKYRDLITEQSQQQNKGNG